MEVDGRQVPASTFTSIYCNSSCYNLDALHCCRLPAVRDALQQLASSLWQRMVEDTQHNGRLPARISLTWRQGYHAPRSKSGAMPAKVLVALRQSQQSLGSPSAQRADGQGSKVSSHLGVSRDPAQHGWHESGPDCHLATRAAQLPAQPYAEENHGFGGSTTDATGLVAAAAGATPAAAATSIGCNATAAHASLEGTKLPPATTRDGTTSCIAFATSTSAQAACAALVDAACGLLSSGIGSAPLEVTRLALAACYDPSPPQVTTGQQRIAGFLQPQARKSGSAPVTCTASEPQQQTEDFTSAAFQASSVPTSSAFLPSAAPACTTAHKAGSPTLYGAQESNAQVASWTITSSAHQTTDALASSGNLLPVAEASAGGGLQTNASSKSNLDGSQSNAVAIESSVRRHPQFDYQSEVDRLNDVLSRRQLPTHSHINDDSNCSSARDDMQQPSTSIGCTVGVGSPDTTTGACVTDRDFVLAMKLQQEELKAVGRQRDGRSDVPAQQSSGASFRNVHSVQSKKKKTAAKGPLDAFLVKHDGSSSL